MKIIRRADSNSIVLPSVVSLKDAEHLIHWYKKQPVGSRIVLDFGRTLHIHYQAAQVLLDLSTDAMRGRQIVIFRNINAYVAQIMRFAAGGWQLVHSRESEYAGLS